MYNIDYEKELIRWFRRLLMIPLKRKYLYPIIEQFRKLYEEKFIKKYGVNYTINDVFNEFIESVSKASPRFISDSEKKEIFSAIKEVFSDITQRKLK